MSKQRWPIILTLIVTMNASCASVPGSDKLGDLSAELSRESPKACQASLEISRELAGLKYLQKGSTGSITYAVAGTEYLQTSFIVFDRQRDRISISVGDFDAGVSNQFYVAPDAEFDRALDSGVFPSVPDSSLLDASDHDQCLFVQVTKRNGSRIFSTTASKVIRGKASSDERNAVGLALSLSRRLVSPVIDK